MKDERRTRYKTKRMNHHRIVAEICHEIGLIKEIDKIVGRGDRKVNSGEATLAMVENGLGFSSRAFYLVSDLVRSFAV